MCSPEKKLSTEEVFGVSPLAKTLTATLARLSDLSHNNNNNNNNSNSNRQQRPQHTCLRVVALPESHPFFVSVGRSLLLQTEVGVVLFGLPESETANKLNEQDVSDYLGVKEYCM